MNTTLTDLTPALVDSVLVKMNRLATELNDEMVERNEAVALVLRAISSGSHAFLLGEPGVAKTMLAERTYARFDLPPEMIFEILFGSYTGPTDFEGPADVAGMETGHWRRLVEGYAPNAIFWFVDEIWKANDSILNSLLWMTNERQYKHDGKKIKIPLSTMLCGSNELPASSNLLAIYDRIPQRYVVEDVVDRANLITVLRNRVTGKLAPAAEVEKFLTLDDLQVLKLASARMPVAEAALEAIAEIRKELDDKHNIKVSTRRLGMALDIMQAEALLCGDEEVDTDHLNVLLNILWNDPEQRDDVSKVVLDKANPLQREITQLLSQITKIGDLVNKAVNADEEEERQSIGMETHRKLKAAANEFKALAEKPAAQSKRNTALLEECRSKIKSYSTELVGQVFKSDGPDSVNP